MSYSDEVTLPQRDACSRLLTGLPGGTRQIRYTNMKDLRAAVEECYEDDTQDPFLVVVDVPPTILEDFDSEYLDKGPRITANLPERLLILKTLSNPGHESVASDLIFYIRVGILEMGLPDRLADTRSSRVTSKNGRFVKEPDGSLRQLHQEWPSVVVETGPSEAGEKLSMDARGWLETDGSETRVIVTARIDQKARCIVFRKWTREADGRIAPIVVEEEVMATRKEDTTEVTGDMTFTFEEVVGRQRNEVNEGDIVITRADFREICQNAWAAQGFG
ncbi:hypothetical protein TRV_01817 [Trichophyton verrucosum HKI 0517]|uniref:Uncharacterized protein n=1 Tax=Trichophyton verrucosum (strain HKI 0517) TaxID=663202 RepID=D4D404_TRIVH|nr:uncharacterized protein TRV_01817 [Trichophyton verrucosum HKI 0517]EFE43432.1 hypothetical protein TRV_01817 [Trichophyton verrucosum HKI 0517]